MAPITSDCVAAQSIRFEHGLSSALMALITSDCINGPNHLGLRRGPIHSLRTWTILSINGPNHLGLHQWSHLPRQGGETIFVFLLRLMF